jgi:hypothetical protein
LLLLGALFRELTADCDNESGDFGYHSEGDCNGPDYDTEHNVDDDDNADGDRDFDAAATRRRRGWTLRSSTRSFCILSTLSVSLGCAALE